MATRARGHAGLQPARPLLYLAPMNARLRFVLPVLVLPLLLACEGETPESAVDPAAAGPGGKADGTELPRTYEVIVTAPHCDVCTAADKSWLKARSAIVERVVSLVDGAQHTVDVAQFTFSVREIEAALLRAHARGVTVRLAMNERQSQGDTVSNRLKAAGLDVRFVQGRDNGNYAGLQHAKFMRVDKRTLLTGSNNWSSTGTTINNENTIVMHAAADDPLLGAFGCHFDAMWDAAPDDAQDCSVDGLAAFTPGTRAVGMLTDAIRGAEASIDVLMHHLLFDKLIKELAKAAERGVRVRLVVNEADRAETERGAWSRLRAAGVAIRYKRTNADAYQIMHHKLAIVDGRELFNGSGNWSGSAFFNNYENYVRYTDPGVVGAFRDTFRRLWRWSLSADALDAGLTPARQHAAETAVFFGNLHAHFHAHGPDGRRWDDGEAGRHDHEGERVDLDVGDTPAEASKRAYEYARDRGEMDFLALSPHVVDDREGDPADIPNLGLAGWDALRSSARAVTATSGGAFVALPAFEWSTNSTGNHVNVLGSEALAKVERGRFDVLYDDFLPARAAAGDRPFVMLNHPRTERVNEEYLTGSWDRIYGVNLLDIPNNSQRKKKFNDYGLDDYPPLRDVRDSWIAGDAMPDPVVVAETLANIEAAARPFMRLMEVTVGRGKEFGGETPSNPSLSQDEEGAWSRYVKVHTDFDSYLLSGFRIAPAANHDNHWANWGTGHTTRTAMVAPRLDEAALLDALDARSVYATEDENLALRFYAGERTPMGDALTTLEDRVVGELRLDDPDAPEATYAVRVFRGKVGGDAVEEAQAFESVRGGAWQQLALDVPGEGRWFFYLEVHDLVQDRMAWSAPIWITRG